MNTEMRLITFIFLLIAPSFTVANQYFCITEEASGFKYDTDLKKWKPVLINSDTKYLVSFKNKTVSKLGEDGFEYGKCEIFDFKGADNMICKEDFGEFQMGAKSLRFLRTLPYYDYAIGENTSTPQIQIGTCSKF